MCNRFFLLSTTEARYHPEMQVLRQKPNKPARKAQSMIKPTVGRIVHFFTCQTQVDPLPAIVACVHGDRCVNLAIFDGNGVPHPEPPLSITLVQPGDDLPEDGAFCTWMPYQIKKDTGSESGEKAAGTESI